MSVTAKWYGKSMLSLGNKEIDFAADTLKFQLHTNSYTPNQDTHDYHDDLTDEVSNGNGYATGGDTLDSASVSYTAGTNVFAVDGDDCAWTSATFTARYAVLVDTTPGSSATNPVIMYIDFGADVSVTNGTFTLQFHGDGICKITVS